MSDNDHWFADVDDNQVRRGAAPWRPYIQIWGGCHPIDGIWFHTKEDCEDFIREIMNAKADLQPSTER